MTDITDRLDHHEKALKLISEIIIASSGTGHYESIRDYEKDAEHFNMMLTKLAATMNDAAPQTGIDMEATRGLREEMLKVAKELDAIDAQPQTDMVIDNEHIKRVAIGMCEAQGIDPDQEIRGGYPDVRTDAERAADTSGVILDVAFDYPRWMFYRRDAARFIAAKMAVDAVSREGDHD